MSYTMIWNEEDFDFILAMLITTYELLKEKNMLEDGFEITDGNRDEVLCADDSLELTDDEVSVIKEEMEENCTLLDVSHALELTDEEMSILLMNTKDDEDHIIDLFLQSATDDDPESNDAEMIDSMDE